MGNNLDEFLSRSEWAGKVAYYYYMLYNKHQELFTRDPFSATHFGVHGELHPPQSPNPGLPGSIA